MKKRLSLLFILTLVISNSYGQAAISKTIYGKAKNKLEEKYCSHPNTNYLLKVPPKKNHTIFTIPFLQLDSSIITTANADSSLFTNNNKKEFVYDLTGNIIEEVNSNWDTLNQVWKNNIKTNNYYFSGDSLASEEHYEWDTINLAWLAKNKRIYSYALNHQIDTNIYLFWNIANSQWLNTNSDIYNYNANNSVANYTRTFWDTTSASWIPEFTLDYTYDTNNNRIMSVRSNWDTISNQWINSYKVENTYDLNSNFVSIYGYTWDSGSSSWQNDEKISFNYDINNNKTEDTNFVWNTSNFMWDYTYLQTYVYDVNNNVLSNTNYTWNVSLLIWVESERYEYTYDMSNNRTNEIYNYWNGTNWGPFFKATFSNFIGSNSTETSNYFWDLGNLVWIPTDKIGKNYDLAVLYADIIFPFYYAENDFHHKLDSSNTYTWDELNLNWTTNEKTKYYYSNTLVGIKEMQIVDHIITFPNPTTDVVNFKLPKEETNFTIDVFNCTGAKLISVNNANKISVSDLNSGLYIYTITSKNNVYKGKFIKE
jgi:hypothetical protein